MIRSEVNPDTGESSIQFKTGNREQDPQRQDFRWIKDDAIRAIAYPAEVCVLERVENGDFYGYVKGVAGPDLASSSEAPVGRDFLQGVGFHTPEIGRGDRPDRRRTVRTEQSTSRDSRQAASADATARIGIGRRQGRLARPSRRDLDRQIAELQADSQRIKEQSDRLVSQQQQRLADLRRNVVVMANAAGKETPVALVDIVRFYNPNAMGFLAKCGHYLGKIGELLWENPRESNTEGGLFPAIFGTVMLIFLMAVTCFPLGVLAGIYLGEYAKDGFLVRLVRIAVNNLAGIPSIVYGIFGLGFFVYGIGGLLDQWFFPERVAAGTPTFGTGGILWASLTLGLLTVPVVIVSTEEALRAIPRATREGSYRPGGNEVPDSGSRAGADGLARHDDRLHPGDGPGGRRSGPADDYRRGETGPADAGRRRLPVLPSRPEVHAPGLPHLRRRLPVAQRRGQQADGVRHHAAAVADRAGDDQRGDLPAKPHAKALSGADDLRPSMTYAMMRHEAAMTPEKEQPMNATLDAPRRAVTVPPLAEDNRGPVPLRPIPSSRRETFASTTAPSKRCSTSRWIFLAIR